MKRLLLILTLITLLAIAVVFLCQKRNFQVILERGFTDNVTVDYTARNTNLISSNKTVTNIKIQLDNRTVLVDKIVFMPKSENSFKMIVDNVSYDSLNIQKIVFTNLPSTLKDINGMGHIISAVGLILENSDIQINGFSLNGEYKVDSFNYTIPNADNDSYNIIADDKINMRLHLLGNRGFDFRLSSVVDGKYSASLSISDGNLENTFGAISRGVQAFKRFDNIARLTKPTTEEICTMLGVETEECWEVFKKDENGQGSMSLRLNFSLTDYAFNYTDKGLIDIKDEKQQQIITNIVNIVSRQLYFIKDFDTFYGYVNEFLTSSSSIDIVRDADSMGDGETTVKLNGKRVVLEIDDELYKTSFIYGLLNRLEEEQKGKRALNFFDLFEEAQ